MKQAGEFMKKILQIFQKYNEIIRYIFIGGCTTLVSLISYYVLISSLLNPNNPLQLQIANIISWLLAVTFAFFTNKKIVFKSESKKIGAEAFKFFTSRLVTLFIDILFMFITVTLIHFNPKIAKLFVQLIILVLNYILSKFIVFKNSKEIVCFQKIEQFVKKHKYILVIGIIIC